MLTADKFTGRTARCNGKEYLFFSGTAYLGMNSNSAFSKHIQEGFSRYGNNYGSSRNSNFKLGIYEEAELRLAEYAGAPAALTVSSGYLAGQLVIRSLNKNSYFIIAPDAHPAVLLNSGDFFNGDFETWSSQVVASVNQSPTNDVVIACNSLDPLLSRSYNFDWVEKLPSTKNITLIIDDSHGFGVTGSDGSGILKQIRHGSNVNLIIISSLGKAMGIPGGVIFADKSVLSLLKQNPYFGASSPVAPAYLFAFLQSEQLYTEAREKLLTNIEYFARLTKSSEIFQQKKGYPVFYTPKDTLAAFLEKRNILISSFAYPLPGDKLITRVIINSNHLEEDLDQLSQHIFVMPEHE